MVLNKQMSQMAQAYAQKIAAQGVLKHSSRLERQGQGENLSMGCKTGPNGGQTVTEAITNWYVKLVFCNTLILAMHLTMR